nr:PREDICTED: brain and acute leukemia cytoplasmic protein [Apteryx mantelli mantelli]
MGAKGGQDFKKGDGHPSTLPCWQQPAGILEDGKSTQTGVTTASTTTGILNTEKKPSCGAQCANPTVPATGAVAQRPSSFRTAESKWDTKKMPTKEVTINVAKSIRQSDRRIAKNCVN